MPITLTDKAAQEVKNLLAENDKQGAALRVWVAGGGCSGLQYGMAIDEQDAEENDLIFESHGVKILIDPGSLQYMDGSSVDYLEEQFGGGFKIENPNATGSCGCGSSFQTEDGQSGCGSCGCNG